MTFKQRQKIVLLLITLMFLTGCNRLFFHPMKEEVLTPKKLELNYKDIYLITEDKVQIHGWHIPSIGTKKGTLIFFHGNAQNISTHIASIHWLPKHNYDVYIFDYRGYGRSQGDPSIEGVMRDASTVLEYVINELNQQNVIVFGQSLGGIIALNAVANFKNKIHIKALIIDSAFSGFRKIAREKLSDVWLTWPFQYPLSLAFTSSHNSILAATKIKPIPLLVIHGNADQVIPLHHGKKIFNAASPPKTFWELNNGKHIESTTKKNIREYFLRYIDTAINDKIIQNLNYTINLNSRESNYMTNTIPITQNNE